MDLYELNAGDRIRTVDGSVAEIAAVTEDGEWIRVKYIDSLEHPELINTEDLCSEDEIAERVFRLTRREP